MPTTHLGKVSKNARSFARLIDLPPSFQTIQKEGLFS